MLAAGFLLIYVIGQLSFSREPRAILTGLAIVLWVGGFVTIKWASQERWSLNKPEAEEPPSIFKK